MKRILQNKLPAALVAAIKRYRRRETLAAFREAGSLFIHIPRAGGTSLSSALYGVWINHFTLREHLRVLPADLLALPRFAIARNPFDRAVSAWAYAKAGRGREGQVTMKNPHQYRTAAFDTFETFVLDWLAQQDLDTADCIFQPQLHFIMADSGAIGLDHLGRLEDLAQTARWIERQTGRAIRIPQLNASQRSDYRDYYSPAARDAVARIYRDDLEALGYDF